MPTWTPPRHASRTFWPHNRDDLILPEWIETKKPIEDRQRTAKTALAKLTVSGALIDLIGNGEQLRDQWSTFDLERQHQIVRAVVEHMRIGPGTPGVTRFDPAGSRRYGVTTD